MDVVIFRENTEDVYAGIEFAPRERPQAERLIPEVSSVEGRWASVDSRRDSGIGIRPMSETASQAAGAHGDSVRARPTSARVVTLVHKGNIMKFTEGAFRDWGYEVAKDEFGA